MRKIFTVAAATILFFSNINHVVANGELNTNYISDGTFENGVGELWYNYLGSINQGYSEVFDSNVLYSNEAEVNRSFELTESGVYILSAKMAVMVDESPRIGLQVLDYTGGRENGKIGNVLISNPRKSEIITPSVTFAADAGSYLVKAFCYNKSWKYGNFAIDDVAVEKLRLTGNLELPASMTIPSVDETPCSYDIKVNLKNQMGEIFGSSSELVESIDYSWSLKEQREGVTINPTDGSVILDSTAKKGEITILCGINVNFKNNVYVHCDIEETVELKKQWDIFQAILRE